MALTKGHCRLRVVLSKQASKPLLDSLINWTTNPHSGSNFLGVADVRVCVCYMFHPSGVGRKGAKLINGFCHHRNYILFLRSVEVSYLQRFRPVETNLMVVHFLKFHRFPVNLLTGIFDNWQADDFFVSFSYKVSPTSGA